MARITVEDCIDKFPSRFELVLIASNRARKLYAGEDPTVEIDNDKNTVIALREIAEETLTKDQLKNDLIEEYQTNTFSEDDDINELEDNTDDDQSEVNELMDNQIEQEDDNTGDLIDPTPTDSLEENNSSDEDKVQDL
tara:strand:+ start:70 stop:483 length:414 start_codon:yes stop_codon:yes gene_type:complete